MKTLEINISEIEAVKEIEKLIGFVSEDITEYKINDSKLQVSLVDEANDTEIENAILNLVNQYFSTKKKEKTIYSKVLSRTYIKKDALLSLHDFEPGILSMDGKALFLYNYFEKQFISFATEEEKENCIQKKYPVLLPTVYYKKTGYLKNSPQYAMFCCPVCENIDKLQHLNSFIGNNEIDTVLRTPKHALSPSACFHTYAEYQNKELLNNTTVTFTQSVFRNEGRFNYEEYGRLRDYHVREIVFIGDDQYVSEMREKILNRSINLMEQLKLNGIICTASDPFIIPAMQKYKKIQLLESTKYELRLNYTENNTLSVASFNLHGTAFTYPFNIKVKDCEKNVTGCVGFGLERWVLAFLSQYGENEENWPQCIKEEYKGEKC